MLDFNIGVGLKLFWKNNFLSRPRNVKILYQSWLILVQFSENGCVIYLSDLRCLIILEQYNLLQVQWTFPHQIRCSSE